MLKTDNHRRPFISPILFPNLPSTLPPSLAVLSPVTAPAHPSHTALSCATLHPSDPSCVRTFTQYTLSAFPGIAKFFVAIYTFFAIPRYRKFYMEPFSELTRLARQVLRASVFITGSIGTSWASICLFQALLPRMFLSTSRWFWGGFLGGLWAFVNRQRGRAQFMYSVRMSLDSFWKVGRKRSWWQGVQGGDVAVFVASLALTNAVFELREDAVDSEVARALGWLRGRKLLSRAHAERTDRQECSRSV